MGLFLNTNLPLSKRLMPKTLESFIGQEHLTGEGKPIRAMIDNKTIYSMIFYGPPATGKTSLAEIIAGELKCSFIRTNALQLDNDGIRKILASAEERSLAGVRTIVFIDEIHRLIKPKQDAFLSSLENGEIAVIGATTENPYFVMQPALRSRLFIYEFKPHTREDLEKILDNAISDDTVLSKFKIEFGSGARDLLIGLSGDARRLLNILEMAVFSSGNSGRVAITRDKIFEITQSAETKYSDKEGHYDAISAFIKSVRGSDPDASLYYLAIMLEGGEDPLFIARRLIILSSEDIGLAYPEGLTAAVSCYEGIERIGMPEGRILLAFTTVLLAGVPKSNTAYMALNKAQEDIKKGNIMNVPDYLRSSSFSGAEDLGRGIGYKYPHDFENHYIDQ
ncbi:MAG: replication-associated recombination protein A, partial [Brevinematales bacterium]